MTFSVIGPYSFSVIVWLKMLIFKLCTEVNTCISDAKPLNWSQEHVLVLCMYYLTATFVLDVLHFGSFIMTRQNVEGQGMVYDN